MKYLLILTVLLTAISTATAAEISFTAIDSLEIYYRPHLNSTAWSTIIPGDSLLLEVRTETGWLGFDPGVAQAANTCSFRYRWLPPDENIESDSLPVVWAPKPDVSYAMTEMDTPVYPDQDTTSTPLTVIPANSAASIEGLTAEWYKVDLYDSPSGENIRGWIQTEGISIN